MQMLKLSAIAAALVAASFSASAMTTIADEDLSAVAGQDGVSIAANLNINIGSFVYSEANDAAHGGSASVGFNNIQITGLMAMTVDVVSQNTFSALYQGMTGQSVTATQTVNAATGVVSQTQGTSTLSAAAQAAGYGLGTAHSAAEQAILTAQGIATAGVLNDQTSAFYGGGDVVQFAFPNVSVKAGTLVDIKVGGITMGVNGQQATPVAGNATGPSFGSFAINQLDLRGTTVWMWAH